VTREATREEGEETREVTREATREEGEERTRRLAKRRQAG